MLPCPPIPCAWSLYAMLRVVTSASSLTARVNGVVLVNGCLTPVPVEVGNMEIFGLLLTIHLELTGTLCSVNRARST